MKKTFAWLLIAATMAAMPISAYAAESSTCKEIAVIEQREETRPAFDGEKKFPVLPEGFEKLRWVSL